MSKEFYDKYGKLVDCFNCNCIEPCSKSDSPLCSEGYVFFAKDKIADLEAKLAESEKKNFELVAKLNLKEHKPAFCALADRDCEALGQVEELKQKLAEYEENNKLLEMQLQDMERSKLSWENQYFTLYNTLKNYREVTEKQLTEKDKLINNYADDLEKVANENADLVFKLAEKEKEIESYEHTIDQYEHELEVYKHNDNIYANSIISFANKNKQDKISFAVEQLEKVKDYAQHIQGGLINYIDNQIKQLKEMK